MVKNLVFVRIDHNFFQFPEGSLLATEECVSTTGAAESSNNIAMRAEDN